MYRIWCERPLPPTFAPLLEGVATATWAPTTDSAAVMESLQGAQAIIASSRIRYDAQFFDQLPSLRVISRTGIGVDNITLADATARGIAVCNTPDVPSIATAEHAILLMLALLKDLSHWQGVLRLPERKDFFSAYNGMQAEGLQLGVVGLGRIGSRVARVARALEMRVVGFDPFCPPERPVELGIEFASSLEDLLATSDVVTLHLPATPETYHLLNAERFAQMKPGSYLVNTARGTLVDEDALINALETGHLRGAGLDVLNLEPPSPDHPLLHRQDVIVTPHIGGATVATKERLWREAINQALQVLRGERPPNLVNAEVWQLGEKP